MSRRRKDSPPSRGDYEVGYGKPPAASRFKPGQSGNPRGRPKQMKQLPELFRKEANRRYSVRDGDRTLRLTADEIIMRNLAAKAMKGDTKALLLYLQLRDRCMALEGANTEAQAPLLEEDEALIAEHFAEWAESEGLRREGSAAKPKDRSE